MVNVHSVQVVVCGQFAYYKLHCCLPRAPRVYSYRINHCMLGFIILPVLWGTVTGVVIKVCALSLCMLVVV